MSGFFDFGESILPLVMPDGLPSRAPRRWLWIRLGVIAASLGLAAFAFVHGAFGPLLALVIVVAQRLLVLNIDARYGDPEQAYRAAFYNGFFGLLAALVAIVCVAGYLVRVRITTG